MARRTSSRAASHDQYSSPPKPDASRRTVRSPQKRSTRATRSQSRDLDEPYAQDLRQGGGSVDSVGSDASRANNSRGKKVRGNAPIQPDLSMVAEDEEMQGSLENEEEAQEFPSVQQPPEPMPGLSEISQPAPSAKKSLLPAAQIRSTSRGSSLYWGPTSVSYLFSKNPQASAVPPSNQQQLQQQVAAGPSAPKTPQNSATRHLPSTAPAKTSQEEHPEADDNRHIHFSNEDFANMMTEYDAEKNKENRPLTTEAIPQTSATTLPANPQRKSFIERQPSAHRVSQISDSDADSQPDPTAKQHAKRTREEPEEVSEHEVEAAMGEDEIPEDDGFEQDRARLLSRFRDPPPEVIQVTGGSRKRARIPSRVVSHGPVGEVQSRQPRIEPTASRLQQQPSSSRVQGSNVVSPIEEKLNERIKAYHQAQHQATQYDAAREMAAQQAQARQLNIGAHRPTQRRMKWTQDEEAGFINLIGRYGVGWAALHARGHAEGIFDECRNQGSLKDKARNMKVDFLISGGPLPANFDLIAIGQKERDKVLSRGKNPYRKEGELVGQEAIDMDGQPRGVFD
ncbi:hypothetical protein VC83_00108 [Pseudogymnoascus destructans]|uniref:Myb-like domain-containing protein n=2 Tax=Pseudogymnoascus destructans TaxID=655981 RepID=L8GDH2_PSED2|nr:uncharacterized protein VC83_00108 [Pseudogymnoascus destructans]ELR10768.1 hypothetical protein GMDG_05023 [Pseudogymnoascus destructans 20631-21]OAF63073.1 hypothetical protein VC83_00108 [Pseudogymnoascus destructans]